MKAKTRFNLLILLLFTTLSFAQLDTYNYKMEIKGISEQWHSLIIPNDVFAVASNSLDDIRIYGIDMNDTIEAPFFINVPSDKKISNAIAYKILNESKLQNKYFFTFEIPKEESINEIKLDFNNKNFDWKVVLQASQDQSEWFTVLEDYRILSIINEQTDYTFSQLNIPPSKYRYYRISILSEVKPELGMVSIVMEEKSAIRYQDFKDFSMNTTEEKENQTTDILIDLDQRRPISFLKLNVADTYDYYRPISIEYASDSVKSEKGWRYRYHTLSHGTLNSIEKNEFTFPSTLAKKLKITIQNHDNQPLEISGAKVQGKEHKIVARFNKKGAYYLTYGKEYARKPNYDIKKSVSKIPKTLTNLSLGNELRIPKKVKEAKRPIFENKLWLWGIMGLIILVLGFFTLKMMSKK